MRKTIYFHSYAHVLCVLYLYKVNYMDQKYLIRPDMTKLTPTSIDSYY